MTTVPRFYNIRGRDEAMRPVTISGQTVLDSLDPANPLHRAWIGEIESLVANGERYTGQSGDVLSSAYAARHRTTVEPWEAAWVARWS